jgi:hypothetical protein
LQSAGECLLLWVRSVDVGTEYSESLLDGAFHVVGKALPCGGILSGEFRLRKFLRPVKKLFEGVGGNDIMQQQIDRNYSQIKADVLQIIEEEMERIKNDPELRYLIPQQEGEENND